MFFTVEQAAADLERMEHSKDAIQDLYSAQNWAVSTCIWALSENQNNRRDVKRLDEFDKQFAESKWTTLADDRNPELAMLQKDFNELGKTISEIVALKKKEYDSNGTYFFPRDLLYTAFMDMSSLSDRIIAIEKKIGTAEPEELQSLRLKLISFLFAGVICSSAISFALARFLITNVVDRLLYLKDDAYRLAARGEVLPPSNRGDELAALESTMFQSCLSLQEIRERENAILDNAADVICSLDRKLRFTGVNAAAYRVWKYKEEELLGKALAALLPPDAIDATRVQFQVIADGAGEGEIENQLRAKDGELRDVVWSVKWSASESQFYCVLHDVTELRQLQKMKQQFLAIAGHDLRAPLASVSLILERLLAEQVGELTSPARKELNKTRDILGRLLELVNELLELEKFESGKFVLASDCVSAFDVCVLSCETLETMASRAGVSLVKPTNDYAVLADERRLVQSVLNLLSNAIKFSPSGSTISLGLVRTQSLEGRPMIQIRVSDQGPGIPANDLGLIFEKFSQSKGGANTIVKGTGLGLAIVRAIAHAHGGEVGVESAVGNGSTFWLTVPEFLDAEDSDE